MITPCTNICKINPNTGLCIGCNRTIEEIAGWSQMTEDERKKLMENLKTR